MIISHTYRYLFVELPRTGSSAIARELCENYDGHRILWKHAPYHRFLKTASEEERKYFVFSCIRNPLDRTVSIFFKLKRDHHDRSRRLAQMKKASIRRHYFQRRQGFILEDSVDFPAFFMRFHRWPYEDWSCLAHRNFDLIIRFENLQEDFEKTLGLMGIEPKRPLPLVNPTQGRDRDFISQYSPEIMERAKKVFGPFMKKWGYEFPPEWGETRVPGLTMAGYHILNVPRRLYWRYLMRSRGGPGPGNEQEEDDELA